MSDVSRQRAQAIVDYLESHPDHIKRGFKRTFGSMKRAEFKSVIDDVQSIIDTGEPAKREPVAAKPDKAPEPPKPTTATKATDVAKPGDKAKEKTAQA